MKCYSLVHIIDDAFSDFFEYIYKEGIEDRFVCNYETDVVGIKGNNKSRELIEYFFSQRLENIFSLIEKSIIVDPLCQDVYPVKMKGPYMWIGRSIIALYKKLKNKSREYKSFIVLSSPVEFEKTVEILGFKNSGKSETVFLKECNRNFILYNENIDSIEAELKRNLYRYDCF